MNKVILTGRLTQDPEMRHTGNGTQVANFTLAVNRDFKNQQGEREADFINCVVWKKLAELVTNHLSKGRMIAIEGRLQTRSYEDNQGVRRKAVEVVANNVEFLPDGKGKGNGQSNNTQNKSTQSHNAGDIQFDDSDVPF